MRQTQTKAFNALAKSQYGMTDPYKKNPLWTQFSRHLPPPIPSRVGVHPSLAFFLAAQLLVAMRVGRKVIGVSVAGRFPTRSFNVYLFPTRPEFGCRKPGVAWLCTRESDWRVENPVVHVVIVGVDEFGTIVLGVVGIIVVIGIIVVVGIIVVGDPHLPLLLG